GGDKIDFSRGQIGDVRCVAEAEPMAFLRLLPAQIEVQGGTIAVVVEVDLHPIGTGHSQSEFLRLGADLAIVDGQAAAENRLVHPVEGGPSETILLGVGGQRGRRRVGGDTKNNIVGGIDVPLKAYLL